MYRGAAQIELPYPYELGWTYEVTKVDAGGTAKIVRAGPSSAIKWPKDVAPPPDPFPVNKRDTLPDEAEAMPVEGLHLMLVQPFAGSAEPRLLRVEVERRRRQGIDGQARQGRRGHPLDRRPLFPDPASKHDRCPAPCPPGGHSLHDPKRGEQVANGAIAGKIAFKPVPHRKRPVSKRLRDAGLPRRSGRQALA